MDTLRKQLSFQPEMLKRAIGRYNEEKTRSAFYFCQEHFYTSLQGDFCSSCEYGYRLLTVIDINFILPVVSSAL